MLAEFEAHWGVLPLRCALIGDDLVWKHGQAEVEPHAERNPLDFTTDAPKWMSAERARSPLWKGRGRRWRSPETYPRPLGRA